MGCTKSKSEVTPIKLIYYPVKNAYLLHTLLKGSPSLGVLSFNSQTYSIKPLNIAKLYPGHNICWVSDDSLFLAGGSFQVYQEILEAYLINTFSFKATRLANMVSSHSDFTMISHKSSVYIISGYNSTNKLTSAVEKYQPNNTWTTCKNILNPRSSASGVSIGDKLYVLGGNLGYNNARITDSIEEYDCIKDHWTELQLVLPLPLNKLGAVKISETAAFFFGGELRNGQSYYSFELDFSSMKYSEKQSMPKHGGGWLFTIEGKYYMKTIYCIEHTLQDIAVYENSAWKVQRLRPEFMNNVY